MADQIKMSTLRVSSEYDAKKWTSGVNEQIAASDKLLASQKEVQVTFAQTDAKVSQAGDILARLSRQYVDGYAAQQRFDAGLQQLSRGVERGAINMQQASKILDGMYQKFGLVADGAQFAARGQHELARAITEANARMQAQQQLSAQNNNLNPFRLDEMRARFDTTFASMRKLQAELNDLAELEREGIQITGGYAAAMDRVIIKYDERAAAADRLAQAERELIEESRRAQTASEAAFQAAQSQATFNQRLGVRDFRSGAARESAGVFEAAAREEERLAAAAEKLRTELNPIGALMARINQEIAEYTVLLQKGLITTEEFGRAQEIALSKAPVPSTLVRGMTREDVDRLRQQQNAQNFGADLDARFALSGKSARESMGVFEEVAREEERLAAAAAKVKAELDPQTVAFERAKREIAEYEVMVRKGLLTVEEFTRASEASISRVPGPANLSRGFTPEQIDQLRQQQNASNFRADLDAQFALSGKSARESAAAFEEAAREEELFAKRAQLLRNELDPLAAAQDRANREIEEYTQLLQRGVISQEEFNKGVALARQRQSVPGSGRNNQALGAFGAFATGQQLQDIAVTAAMGQSIPTIALQQGLQLGTSLEIQLENARRAGVGMATALRGAFLGILSPVNLVAIGLTAVAAAAIQFFMNQQNSAKGLKEAIEDTNKAVRDLAEAYHIAAINADDLGRKRQSAADAQFRNAARDLQKSITQGFQEDTGPDFLTRLQLFGGAAPKSFVTPGLSVAGNEINDIRKTMEAGRADAEFWARKQEEIAKKTEQTKSAMGQSRDILREMLGLPVETFQELVDQATEVAAKYAEAAKHLEQMQAAAHMAAKSDRLGFTGDDRTRGLFVRMNPEAVPLQGGETTAERELSAQRDAAMLSAQLAQINARTLDERIAAVKQLEEAKVVEHEKDWQAALRVTNAVTLEAARAEKELADARRERAFAREDSITGAQNELDQVGKTAGEVARLRMEYEGMLELRREERRTGRPMSQDEANAVRETAKAYGELTDSIAKAKLQSDLRFQASIAGLNAEDAAIAQALHSAGLEANLNSQEAQAMRTINQINRIKDTWQDVFDHVNDGIDRIFDSLFDGGKDFGETLKGIGRDLARMVFDLAITNPLKNWLTGANLNTIADLGIFKSGATSGRGGGFGGAIGSLFGLDKTIGAMSVQAATVIVNGGIGGGSLIPGLNNLIGGSGSDADAEGILARLMGGSSGGTLAANDNVLKTVGGAFTQQGSQSILDSLGSGGFHASAVASAFKSAGMTSGGIPLSQISIGDLTAKIDTRFASRFQGLLDDLKSRGYPITSLGEGGYSFRNVAGTNNLSNHAYGQALDINPGANFRGGRGDWAKYGIDPNELAKAHDLTYGGNFKYTDPMHFQVPGGGRIPAGVRVAGGAGTTSMPGGMGSDDLADDFINSRARSGSLYGGTLGTGSIDHLTHPQVPDSLADDYINSRIGHSGSLYDSTLGTGSIDHLTNSANKAAESLKGVGDSGDDLSSVFKGFGGNDSLGFGKGTDQLRDTLEKRMGDGQPGSTTTSLEDSIAHLTKSSDTAASKLDDTATSAANSATGLDGLGKSLGSLFGGGGSGGGGIGGLLSSINSLLSRAGGGLGSGSAFSVLSGIGGSILPLAGPADSIGGSLFGGMWHVMHTGGVAGVSGGSYRYAAMPTGRLPRMHYGGIAGDEVPAILKRGEPVYQSMSHARQSVANQNVGELAAEVAKRLNVGVKNIIVQDDRRIGDYLMGDPGEKVVSYHERRTAGRRRI